MNKGNPRWHHEQDVHHRSNHGEQDVLCEAYSKAEPHRRRAQRTARAHLEDGGRGSATEAAGRVERVDAKQLVDEAAGDAEHGSTAVLALSIELERLGLRVVVAHPQAIKGDVARLAILLLRLGREAHARLLHAGEDHDLQPARSRTASREAKQPAGTSENL